MGFNAELFQTLLSQGVPAEAAVQAATTADAPAPQAPVAPAVPAATFQPPANVVQPQAAAPVTPPAKGSIAQALAQGSKSNGHGPTAKFPAVGTKVEGLVARDMTDLDVTQETDFATKAPKFEKDNVTPKWQMTIPLNVAPSPEFPEGKTTVWVKGRMLKSAVRAMIAAGYDVNNNEALRQNDHVSITRIQDSPTNYGNAAREYDVVITRGGQTVAQGTYTEVVPTSPAPATPAAPPVAPAASTPTEAPAAPAPAAPDASGLTPEQQALIAQYAGK